MTAYLKWQGMTEAELSLYRGAGAISGLLSTTVFPTIHNKTGKQGIYAMLCYAMPFHAVLCHAMLYCA